MPHSVMNRRNSNNAHRLDHRRSATSVRGVHLDHINPETAERDAQVAATQAFARARERTATDSSAPLWPPPRSSVSTSYTNYTSPRTMTPAHEASSVREQSIRFVQPGQAFCSTKITTGQGTAPYHGSHDILRETTNDAGANARPQSRASASGMVSAAKGAAGEYITTLFDRNEYYTPEDDIASQPSSFRKLRKSKSMFTDTAATMRPVRSNKTSMCMEQFPGQENTSPPTSQSIEISHVGPTLRSHKSMSFLRDWRGGRAPGFRSGHHSDSIMPSSGYHSSQDGAWATLRSKSSMLFRNRASTQDRTFRKSMRDTKVEMVLTNKSHRNDGSLRIKARKVSQGFRYKLKSLLGLGSNDNEESDLPKQHIEAQRPYPFDSEDLTEEDHSDGLPDEPPARISQVTSGVPVLRRVPPYQHLRSHQGSIENLQSERKASDERSRVTSWTNSDASAASTLNSREERDRRRLTIIDEDGAYVSSSSVHLGSMSEQPNTSTSSLHQPVKAPRVAVDGQRIYSALMKRIEQSKGAKICEQEGERSLEDIGQFGEVTQHKGSLSSQPFDRNAAATIRYVMPESDSDTDVIEACNSQQIGQERLSTTSMGLSRSFQPANETNETTPDRGEFEASSVYTDNTGDAASKDVDTKRPPTRGKPVLAPPSSTRSSVFFGSPTRHLFRTQSPYRRALQERMKTRPSNEPPLTSAEFNPWMRSISNIPNLQLPYSSNYGSDADLKMHYAESIYSSHTEDIPDKRQLGTIPVSESGQQQSNTHGDVTIFVNSPSLEKRSSSVPPKPRVSSSSSSVEWKTWLSSNVSKLEESTANMDMNDLNCSLSSSQPSRHIREIAQIDDEEDHHLSGSPGQPGTPCPVRPSANGRGSTCGILPLGSETTKVDANDRGRLEDESGDEGDEYDDADIPVSFRASDSRQPPCVSSSGAGVTGPNAMSRVTPPQATSHNALTGLSNINREKALPDVPTRTLRQTLLDTRENLSTKLKERQAKLKTSMTNLTNRTPGGDHSGKVNKLSNSQQRLADRASTKLENVSPAMIGDSDAFNGDRVSGNHRRGLGSERIVDIFLDSRRRQMENDDDGNVFL